MLLYQLVQDSLFRPVSFIVNAFPSIRVVGGYVWIPRFFVSTQFQYHGLMVRSSDLHID